MNPKIAFLKRKDVDFINMFMTHSLFQIHFTADMKVRRDLMKISTAILQNK